MFGFDSADILPARGNDAAVVYVEGVYLKPEYQNDDAYFLPLIQMLFMRIAEFSSARPLKQVTIIAEAFTPAGTKLLRSLGFRASGTSVLGYRIHELNCDKAGLRGRARDTVSLIEQLRQRIANGKTSPNLPNPAPHGRVTLST